MRPTRLKSALLAALALILALGAAVVPARTNAIADDVDEARRQVERLQEQVSQVRRQYDALANEVASTSTDLDSKQSQIVNTTIEMNRKQDEINQDSIEFERRVRQAYKAGPTDSVSLFLSASSLADYWAANRYLAHRLERDRELIEEMKANQEGLGYLATRLEQDRGEVQAKLDQLADLLDQTQFLLADSGAALAASEADLHVKEELRKALDLINRGSTGEKRPLSERHRRSTEDQAALMKKYPFGPISGIPPGLAPTGETVEGIASWYGPGFNGLPTASGAIYDENLYTCASKELPLGTILIVTYQGSSVLLLVNDRGPFVKGRVLDLSRAAKEAIGMGGLGYVTAQVVEPA